MRSCKIVRRKQPKITTVTAQTNPKFDATDTIEVAIFEQSRRTVEKNDRIDRQKSTRQISVSAAIFRMQYDSQYGLLNNAANINNPAILGNELSSRQRLRYRLRFAVRGKIGGDVFTGLYDGEGKKRTDKEFEWGFRLSTGSFPIRFRKSGLDRFFLAQTDRN